MAEKPAPQDTMAPKEAATEAAKPDEAAAEVAKPDEAAPEKTTEPAGEAAEPSEKETADAAKNSDGETALHRAAQKGHEAVVKSLIGRNIDINATNENGWTALKIAANNGNDAVVELLVQHHADLNVRDNEGWTAAKCAAGRGYAAVVKVLAENKADLNQKDNEGGTPLMSAANAGSEAVTKILADNGADLNAVDNDGWTALVTAASRGHASIVQMLIDYKADLNISDTRGWTAVGYAASRGYTAVVKTLAEAGADLNTRSANGWAPLKIAANNGFETVVEILLQNKAAVNDKDNDGWTALMSASSRGYKPTAILLLEHHAEINAQSNKGETALHIGARCGFPEMVKLLLSKDADHSIRDEDGETVLHTTSRHGFARILEELIQHDMDLNAQDSRGWTALHYACILGYIEVVEILLKQDAAIGIADVEGWTSLHKACSRGHKEVMRLLLEEKEGKHIKDWIDYKDRKGYTALHRASSAGHEELVQLLLNNNAEIAEKTAAGETALELATSEGHKRVILALLKSLDDAGKASALEVATDKGHYIVVSALVEIKYDLGKAQSSTSGETALSRAARKEHWSIVRLLLHNMETADFGKNSDLEEKTLTMAARQDHEVVRLLLMKRKGATIDGYEPEVTKNWPSLHWAAYYGLEAAVYWLLANGASPTERDANGDTALMVAKRMAEAKRDQSLSSNNEPREKPISNENANEMKTDLDFIDRKGKGKGQPSHDDGMYTRTLTLLLNPPILQGRPDLDTPYIDPTLKRGCKEESACKLFKATIVDFYEADGSVDLLRRSQEVQNVIYGHGPDKIMLKARAELEYFLRDMDPAAAEKLDVEKEPRMRWIHLPANNMEWMKDLLTRVCRENKMESPKYLELSKFLHRSWYELPGRASRSQFMKSACIRDSEDESRVAIYMPYLTFANYTTKTSPPPSTGHNRVPTIESQRTGQDRHKLLSNAYKGKILHGSQTLDQFYYHTLENTDSRDHDQVVTRYLEHKPKQDWGDSLTILRVDQLWLWAIDDKTIITCSSNHQDEEEDLVLEKIYDHLREQKGKGQGQPPPSSVDEMTKFIITFCISFIDQNTTKDDDDTWKSAQQIFAISINEKAAKEAELFHKFTCKIEKKKERSQRDGAAKVSQSELEDHGETGNPYESINVATKLLEEVKDIRDELNILKSLLKYQKTVWDDLFKETSETNRRRSPAYTMEDIEEMDKIAQRIQKSVNTLLNLDQNEATISEAQQTTQQGRTIMVFTIVTIVFLPMSFLASVFALNVSSFPHNEDIVLYEPGWIFPIIFGVSIAVSFPLVLVALNTKTITDFMKAYRKRTSSKKGPSVPSTFHHADDLTYDDTKYDTFYEDPTPRVSVSEAKEILPMVTTSRNSTWDNRPHIQHVNSSNLVDGKMARDMVKAESISESVASSQQFRIAFLRSMRGSRPPRGEYDDEQV